MTVLSGWRKENYIAECIEEFRFSIASIFKRSWGSNEIKRYADPISGTLACFHGLKSWSATSSDQHSHAL